MEALPNEAKSIPHPMHRSASVAGQNHFAPSASLPHWVCDAVFYQVMPDRFCSGDDESPLSTPERVKRAPSSVTRCGGNLKGILRRLDYLQALGITALYFTPVFAAPSGHKYDTADYRSIDPSLGGEGDLALLVKNAHARGIRIILDAVFNHTGTEFFAFKDVCSRGEESPFRNWYFIHDFPVDPPSNPNYECWWGLGALPKLNTSNPEVRDYLYDVTRRWMQFGIDGWRLDVPNEVPQEFWTAWRHIVKRLRPDAYIVGEIWDDAADWLQGDLFDGVMNYPVRDACLKFFAKRTLKASGFDQVLARQRARYPHGSIYGLLNLLGSHDTERFLTACAGDTRALRLATLFLMTYPGAPMVYYGDEVGMQGAKDPGCRMPMVWDRGRQDTDLLGFFRDVIHLRRDHEVLRRGDFESVLCNDRTGVYVYRRTDSEHVALVVLHTGGRTARVDLSCTAPASGAWQQVWPLPAAATPHGDNADCVSLMTPCSIAPYEGRVFIGRRSL